MCRCNDECRGVSVDSRPSIPITHPSKRKRVSGSSHQETQRLLDKSLLTAPQMDVPAPTTQHGISPPPTFPEGQAGCAGVPSTLGTEHPEGPAGCPAFQTSAPPTPQLRPRLLMAAEVSTSFRHLLAHGQERPKASRCLHVDQVSVATSTAECLLGSSRGNTARRSQDFSNSRASFIGHGAFFFSFHFFFCLPVLILWCDVSAIKCTDLKGSPGGSVR